MLQTGFILLTLGLVIILYILATEVSLKAITNPHKQRHFIKGTALVLVCWLIYISAMSVTGIFTNDTLPPRIPLLLIAPAFLFFIYFFTSARFKNIIANTPPEWIVYFQSFRIIVELLIWGLFMKGILPQSATFEGHNFDILIGLTAPLVAYFTFVKNRIGKMLFILWNFAGLATLCIIVSILARHAYFPAMKNDINNILTRGMGYFPYTFLPGFFMPLAVFLHIFSLVKTRKTTSAV